MTDERWLPIPGFEGHYEVSDYGRVRSVDRHIAGPAGWRRSYEGRVLRDRAINQPEHRLTEHRIVTLSVGRVRRHVQVHALVMLAFVGPRPDGMQVCHWNGDGTDNRLSNLRYGSASDNSLDMVRHGSHNNARKTHCPKGHIYDEANTIVNSKGFRECRTCKRATNRRLMRVVRQRAKSA